MPWVKLDDQLWSNPKVIAVGNEATGAYCRMLSYCGAHLTDGHVEDHIVKFIGKPALASQLLDRGFVEEVDGGGLLIPDYLDFNPSKEKKEEERAGARERKRKREEERKANER